MNKTFLAAVIVSLVWPCAIHAQNQPSDPEAARIERLVGLCKLWGAVKFFHPYLAYREDLDWDKAVLAAIPKIGLAANVQDYAAAVQSALEVLQDPVTRVLTSSPSLASGKDGDRHPAWSKTADGILVVRINR